MHSFDNRTVSISEFSSCMEEEDGCDRAVPYLQNDSSGNFQHSKQCKYKEKYLSKFSKGHKRKQTFWQKLTPDVFPISGRHVCAPKKDTNMAVSILISINLCGTLCQITRVRNTAQT